MVTRQMLEQYYDLPKEIQEIQSKIENLEATIREMESDGTVRDIVSGGYGGEQHFQIEGFPSRDYSRKKTMLLTRKSMLVQLQDQLISDTNEIEEFIGNIEDSRMRRIINLRFVERKSWIDVAMKIGGGNTDDTVRKMFTRYMDKLSEMSEKCHV